jgi:hypothetical protein
MELQLSPGVLPFQAPQECVCVCGAVLVLQVH